MRAIKATSLQRKVTKPLKSWEKRQEDKSRGCGEGGAVGAKSLVTGGDRETNRDSVPPRSDSTCTQMQSVGSQRVYNVPLGSWHLLTLGDRPAAESAAFAAGVDRVTGWRKGDRAHGFVVTGVHRDLHAVFNTVDSHSSIRAAAGEQLAVWREGAAHHRAV